MSDATARLEQGSAQKQAPDVVANALTKSDLKAIYAEGVPKSSVPFAQIEALYSLPVPELLHLAQTVHLKNFAPEVQFCSLLSIKTGGCKEDCSYCPQSAHYQTDAVSYTHLTLPTKA